MRIAGREARALLRKTAAGVHELAVAPLPALLPAAVLAGVAVVAGAGALLRPNALAA